jgi:hypothetical protein
MTAKLEDADSRVNGYELGTLLIELCCQCGQRTVTAALFLLPDGGENYNICGVYEEKSASLENDKEREEGVGCVHWNI